VLSGTYTLKNQFNICQNRTLGGNASGYVKAMVDDVRIYNRALSADEIQALYSNSAGRYH